MAILDSVKKLASKVGADTNGRTIAEQINNINRHLDSTGSRDIAEAVSKFADKEDGTAILTTKSITENGTYKASDDNANGYSKVTVDVPMTFNTIKTRYDTPDNSRLLLLRSETGAYAYDPMHLHASNATVILCDPVSAVYGLDYFDTGSFTFTPASEFSGFYLGDSESGGSWTLTGDTITPGDGKLYTLTIARDSGGTRTFVVAKTFVDFDFTIS